MTEKQEIKLAIKEVELRLENAKNINTKIKLEAQLDDLYELLDEL